MSSIIQRMRAATGCSEQSIRVVTSAVDPVADVILKYGTSSRLFTFIFDTIKRFATEDDDGDKNR